MENRITVLIFASESRCEEIKKLLNEDPHIDVAGTVSSAREALDNTVSIKPGVVVIDLGMTVQDERLRTAESIMQRSPVPVIMVGEASPGVTAAALEAGVMDFASAARDTKDFAEDLAAKIKIASRVKPIRRIKGSSDASSGSGVKRSISKVVAIGVSAGGPQALYAVLSGLPPDFGAGILVVQHMSKGFIRGLAEWLDANSPLEVRVASSGDVLRSASVFFAPDGFNLEITDGGVIKLTEAPDEKGGYVPSVDVMMRSAARSFGRNAVGVIMTGMERDGVEGICAVKQAGGRTIGQDEKTSAIFGMNKAAIESGCVDDVVPLEGIADKIIENVRLEV